MCGATHLMVGAAVVSPLIKQNPKMVIFLPFVVLGALLPDVDTDYSLIQSLKFIVFYIGLGLFLIYMSKNLIQVVAIISMFILICLLKKYTMHRTAAHSLLLLIIFSLFIFTISKDAALYFAIGYLTHLILDMATGHGVTFLYPYKKKIKFNIDYDDLEVSLLMYSVFAIIAQFA